MAASNKTELPFEDATKAGSATGNDPTAPVDSTDETSIDDTGQADPITDNGSAEEQNADASGVGAESVEDTDTDEIAVDTDHSEDHTGTFAAAPEVPGEFRVPLSALGEWAYHPRLGSRQQSDHFAALVLTAAEPGDLSPIEVLPAIDGVHPITNGRFLYFALKKAHPGNEDVEVRCVRYPGTEAQAVQAVCDTAVGTMEASAMEKAQALHNHQRVNGISQRAIMDRYPRLKKDKVSNMLIAAKMREAYPVFFDLLTDPDQAPISYGTDILTLKKAVSVEEFAVILDRAADIAGNGERFKPNKVFGVLQADIGGEGATADKPARPKPVVPIKTEEIFGHDDQPVAAYERFSDDVDRISLPDASAMTLEERELAAEACIVQIRRHFGLDEQS